MVTEKESSRSVRTTRFNSLNVNKVKDPTPLAVVDTYVKENTTEIIDPLGAKKKVQELNERVNTLLTELNTKIKVSNATTMISF